MSSFTRYRPEDSFVGAHWTNKHILNSQLRNVNSGTPYPRNQMLGMSSLGMSSPRNQDAEYPSRDFNLGISVQGLGMSSPRNQDAEFSSRDYNPAISDQNHANSYNSTRLRRFVSSNQHRINQDRMMHRPRSESS